MQAVFPQTLVSKITSLIEIRNYVSSSINNHTIPRQKINQLSSLLLLLDRQITDMILFEPAKEDEDPFLSPYLKGYLEFDMSKNIVQEVRKDTNLVFDEARAIMQGDKKIAVQKQ